jgi:AbrB family looped-hinge helix DNA binding protein
MKARLTLDKAGRIVIPKPWRDEMRLGPGDELQLDRANECLILRPVRETIPIRKEDGVWVYRSGRPAKNVSLRSLILQDRETRSR